MKFRNCGRYELGLDARPSSHFGQSEHWSVASKLPAKRKVIPGQHKITLVTKKAINVGEG